MRVRPVMGIIASEGARRSQPVREFVTNHLGFLGQFNILTTGGTFNDLFYAPVPVPQLKITKLRPSYRGGVIQLDREIVEHRCRTMLFFSDPDDLRADSVENRAIVRSCIVRNIELIQSVTSATILAENDNNCFPKPFERQTLALIAHNAKKECMFKFVADHQQSLLRFARIICTGTTGERIQDLFPLLQKKVHRYNSGPDGGDDQIADEILEGRCHHVVFYMDPLNPQPHDANIQMFTRVCQQFEGVNVNFLVTDMSARRWITTVPVKK